MATRTSAGMLHQERFNRATLTKLQSNFGERFRVVVDCSAPMGSSNRSLQ
jgi:hypothetical protein